MKHKSAQRHLADYIEGNLAPRQHARVALHIEHCDECQTEVRELRFTVSLLRGLKDPEPPENLAESVLRRIAAGEAEPSWRQSADQFLERAWNRVSLPQYALPAAGLAGFLAVFWLAPGLDFDRVRGLLAKPQASVVAQTAEVGEGGRHANARGGQALRRSQAEVLGSPFDGPRTAHRGRMSLASAANVSRNLAPFPYAVSAREPVALRSADEWIDVLIERPSEFAGEPTRLSALERELWVTYVARRAVETDRFDRLMRALETSREPVAVALAQDFALLGGRR